MNNLDLVHRGHDGEPETNSYVIAEGTGSNHASVIRLVRDNQSDFEDFGRVGFENQPFQTAGGLQRRTVAALNREQAMLLMTYMRNNEIIRDFKKRLIRAFVELEKAPAAPALPDRRALAQMVIEAEDRAAEEARRALELEAPAKSWNVLASANGDYSVSEAAKVLSRDPRIKIGRDQLFAFMKKIGWIFRTKGNRAHWEANQQKAINTGRLSHKPGKTFLNERTGEYENSNPTIRVTLKGLGELHQILGGSDQIELEGVAA